MAAKLNFGYQATDEDRKAMSICNDNDCFIYPLPLDNKGSQYRIAVYRPKMKDPKNRLKTDPNVYSSEGNEWIKRIFELYIILKPSYEQKKSKTK